MLTLSLELRNRVNVEKIRQDTFGRIDLATARAADLVAGALRRFSLSEGLHGRTGTLAREWKVTRRGPGEYLASNRLSYAAIHEYGGEITPKKAKMLAIPIGAALTARGVSRYLSPRDVPDLFAFTSRRGNVILAKKVGQGRLEPYFVLKEKIQIPARHYATRAVESVKNTVIEVFKRALKS